MSYEDICGWLASLGCGICPLDQTRTRVSLDGLPVGVILRGELSYFRTTESLCRSLPWMQGSLDRAIVDAGFLGIGVASYSP